MYEVSSQRCPFTLKINMIHRQLTNKVPIYFLLFHHLNLIEQHYRTKKSLGSVFERSLMFTRAAKINKPSLFYW